MTCPACGRKARSGIVCRQTFCPFELTVNRQGHITLARPLRQRIK